ncbi:MAG: ATP-binding protein, partial [Inhella sp.]
MDVRTPQPLVPAHVPRNHPVVTREYSLFTPAIATMVDRVAGWIDDQVDGATIFGPSRFGKSSA